MLPLWVGTPHVVGRPATSYDSLTVIGTPCSGPQLSPLASARSAARARARHRSPARGRSRPPPRAERTSMSSPARRELGGKGKPDGPRWASAARRLYSPAMALTDRYGLPITTASAVAAEHFQRGMD